MLEEGSEEKRSSWLVKILVSGMKAVKHNRTLAGAAQGAEVLFREGLRVWP